MRSSFTILTFFLILVLFGSPSQAQIIPPPAFTGSPFMCAGDIPPTMVVTVGINQTADWYDSPTSPIIIPGGFSTTSFVPGIFPDETITYYAGSRDTVTGLISVDRTPVLLRVYQPPSAEIEFDADTLCRDGVLSFRPANGSRFALYLDGVDDYVDLGVSILSTASSTQSYSFMSWIRSLSPDGSIISQHINNTNPTSFMFGLMDGKLTYLKGGNILAQSLASVDDDKWHHVGFSKSSAGFVKLYLDGAEVAASVSPDNQAFDASATQFGLNSDGTFPFEGRLDEMNVWSVVKTQAEFLAQMYTPLSGGELNLVGAWNCNSDPSIPVVFDQAAGNSGFIYGGKLNVSDAPVFFDFLYVWDFGDGTIDTVLSGYHVYSNSGNYDVNLSIRDNHACTDMQIKTVSFGGVPTFNISPTNASCPSATDASVTFGGPPNLTEYTMDGGLSWEDNWIFQNVSPGTYLVNVTNEYDCIGDEQSLIIVSAPDLIPPTLGCAGIMDSLHVDINCEATVQDYLPFITASDNCTDSVDLIITQSPSSGSNVFAGSTVVTFSATDEAGLSSTCSFTVLVEDTIKPLVFCSSDTIILTPGVNCQVLLGDLSGDITAIDNCSDSVSLTITQVPSPGSIITSLTEVEFIVADESGNQTSCSSFFSVFDNEGPLMSCPTSLTYYSDENCTYPLENIAGNLSITDNCTPQGNIFTTQLPSPGFFLPLGNNMVTISAVDLAGNSSTCQVAISVEDSTSPNFGLLNVRVGAVGFNGGNQTYNNPFFNGEIQGTIVRITEAQFNSMTPSQLRLAYDILLFTYGSNPILDADWTTRLNPYMDLGGSIIWEDNVNIGQLSSIVNVNQTLLPQPNQISPVPGLTNLPGIEIQPSFTDPHFEISSWAGSLSPFIFSEGANGPSAVAVYGQIGFGKIIISAVDPDFNAVVPGNEYNYILNSIRWISEEFTGGYAAAGQCEAFINVQPPVGTNDNCGILSLVNDYNNTGNASDVYPVGVTPVTWTATDLSGNTSSVTIMVGVVDNQTPNISCTPQYTVPMASSQCQSFVSINTPAYGDNCSSPILTNTFNNTSDASGDYPVGTTTVFWIVSDSFGNMDSCQFSVVVLDSLSPTITCPNDITVMNDLEKCGAVVSGNDPIASDDCSGLTIFLNTVPLLDSTNFFPVGTTQVNAIATDDFGNTSSCSYSVTVQDTQGPTGFDLIRAAAIGFNGGTQGYNYPFSQGDVSGSIDRISVADFNSMSPMDLYTSYDVLIFTFGTNPALNGDWASRIKPFIDLGGGVIWEDDVNLSDLNPAIVATTQTIQQPDSMNNVPGLTSSPGFPIYAGLTDPHFYFNSWNSEFRPFLFSSDPSGSIPVGLYAQYGQNGRMIITGSDPDFNAISGGNEYEFMVNALLWVSGHYVSGFNDYEYCHGNVIVPLPRAIIDNCGSATFVNDFNNTGDASGVYPVGETMVTWTATDAGGNTATFEVIVAVADTQAPTITCLQNVMAISEPGGCGTTISIPTPAFGDNCSASGLTNNITGSDNASGFYPFGPTNIIWEITDHVGIVSQCTSLVSVTYDVVPTYSCPLDFSVSIPAGACEAEVVIDSPLTNPTCSPIWFTNDFNGLVDASGMYPIGTNIVTWSLQDVNGEFATCETHITVIDTQGPEIIIPPTMNVSCDSDPHPFYTGFALASDNCGNPDLKLFATTFGASKELITLDVFSGASTSLGDISISENIEDIAFSMPSGISAGTESGFYVTIDSPSSNPIPTVYVGNSGFMDVGGMSWVGASLYVAGTYSNGGNSYLATVDPNSGVASSIGQTGFGKIGGLAFDVQSFTLFGIVEASGELLTLDLTTGIGTLVGPTGFSNVSGMDLHPDTRVLYAVSNGDLILVNKTSGAASMVGPTGHGALHGLAFGVTGIIPVTWVDSMTPGNCEGEMVIERTWTSVDPMGNSTSVVQTINVVDTIAPEIVGCPSDSIFANNMSGECGQIISWVPPSGVSDNCSGNPVLSSNFNPGDTLPVGINEVIYLATDDCGNESSCSFIVEIIDLDFPVFQQTCPIDMVVGNDSGMCGGNIFYPVPTAFDNCSGLIGYASLGGESGDFFPVGTTPIEYTISDSAGNTISCSFSLTVIDNEAPQLINQVVMVPADDFCRGLVPDFSSWDVTALLEDNCSSPSTISFSQVTGLGDTVFDGTPTIVQISTTDSLGNTTIHDLQIALEDVTPPTIYQCPGDVFLSVSAGCSGLVPDLKNQVLTFPDNCDGFLNVIHVDQSPAPGTLVMGGEGDTLVLTLTVSDNSGNSSDCHPNLVFKDNTIPVLNHCPASPHIILSDTTCSGSMPDLTPLMDVTDCSNLSFVQNIPPGTPLSIGVVNSVLIISSDPNGNQVYCDVDVILQDTLPPSIQCLDYTISLDPTGLATLDPSNVFDYSSVNCGYLNLSVTPNIFSCSTIDSLVEITLTGIDQNSNMSSCQSLVSTVDIVPPQAFCQNFQIDLDSLGMGSIDPLSIDNGSFDVCSDITLSLSQTNFDCSSLGVNSLVLTVTDDFGNSSSCIGNLTVDRTEQPVFVGGCPENIFAFNTDGQCGTDTSFILPSVFDNCGITSTVSSNYPSTFFSVGATEVVLTAVDMVGITSTCSFYVFVVDTSAPVPTCPQDISIFNEGGTCSSTVFFPSVMVADNCGSTAIIVDFDYQSGTAFPVGTTSVVLTAEDATGNTGTCGFNIEVIDNEPGFSTCPPNYVTEIIDSTICGLVINYDSPAGVDNCGNITVNQLTGLGSGATFPIGTTYESFEIIDPNGNVTTCNFSIVIEDNIPPYFTIPCPDDIYVDNDPNRCDALVFYDEPVGLDNCPGVTLSLYSGLGTGAYFPFGDNEVIWQLQDVSGNSALCTFSVFVDDANNPRITCPNDTVLPATTGVCGRAYAYDLPIATGTCAGVNLIFVSGMGSGSLFPIGTSTEVYQAIDPSGNTKNCSFQVSIEDAEFPELDCPTDIFAYNEPNLCGTVINYAPPIGSDNCPGVTTTISSGQGPGTFFLAGTNIEEYSSTDAFGNVTVCNFTVFVQDSVAPILNCPSDITQDVELDECSSVVFYSSPTFSDNCAGLSPQLVGGLPSGSEFNVGVTNVIYSLIDGGSNYTTCSFSVLILDTELPLISCPNDMVINSDPFTCGAVVNYSAPSFSDNCPGAVLSHVSGIASGMSVSIGVSSVTYEIMDAGGNTASCSFNLEVSDTDPPNVLCFDATIQLEPNGIVQVNPAQINNGSSDNCGINSITVSPETLSCFDIGINQITLTVEDNSGNTANCIANVILEENPFQPVQICNDFSLELDPSGTVSADLSEFMGLGATNCSINIVNTTQSSFNCNDIGINIVTVSYQGNSGLGTCESQVLVNDAISPIANCQSGNIVLGPLGTTIINPSVVDAGSSDNCGIDVMTVSPSTVSIGNIGTTDVTLTVIDPSGNISTCEATLTVYPTPLSLDFDVTPEDCKGFNNGAIDLTVIGGDGPFTFQWAHGSSLEDLNNLSPGNYHVTVTDINLVSVSADIYVDSLGFPIPNPILVPSGPIEYLCSNDSLELMTGNAYVQYSWSSGDTTQTIMVSQAGFYSVVVYNGFGCFASSDVIEVRNATQFTPFISQLGSSLVSSQASSYQWYLDGDLIPGAIHQSHTPATNGNYSVIATSGEGCAGVSSSILISTVGTIAEMDFENLTIYPNPTSGVINIEGNFKTGDVVSISLKTVLGVTLLNETEYLRTEFLNKSLDLRNYSAGVYFIELKIGERSLTRKIVVER